MALGANENELLKWKRPHIVGAVSIVGTFILLLAVVTLLKEQHLGRVDSQLLEEKQVVAAQAHKRIRKDVDDVFNDLLRVAKGIAEDAEVVDGLERFTTNADPVSQKQLIEQFSTYSVDDQHAVELYTVAPRLVAWKGFSMPIGESPKSTQFSYDVQYEVVQDRGVWTAMVAWYPVNYGGRVIGAVRAMQLVEVQMPVENQYLESYTLDDSWRRLTQLPVQVWLNVDVELAEILSEEAGEIHSILDPSGESLGSVYIPYPSQQDLKNRISNQYIDLQTLLLTLLMFSLVTVLIRSRPAVMKSPTEKQLWTRKVPHFLLLAVSWWGLRYAMLYLEVPARWQRGKAPLAPLFDVYHFASDFGGGLFKSIGDTFITGIWVLLFSIWLFQLVSSFSNVWKSRDPGQKDAHPIAAAGRSALGFLVSILISFATIHALGTVIYKAVLDSKLDYVERSGIIPDRLVFFMFCTLMIIGIASVIIQVACTWFSVIQARLMIRRKQVLNAVWVGVLLLNALAVWVYTQGFEAAYHVPIPIIFIFIVSVWGGCIFIAQYPSRIVEWLHFRAVLLGILLLAVPLYAMLDRGIDARLRQIMEESVSTFTSRQDPRVVFAIQEVLVDAGADDNLAGAIMATSNAQDTPLVSDLVNRLLRLSSLSSLITHDVSITVFDTTNTRLEGVAQGIQDSPEVLREAAERDEYITLKGMYEESRSDSILVDILTGRYEEDRFQYGGIGPIYVPNSDTLIGWVVARAEPRALLRDEGTLFPKVLLPQGVNQLQGNLSLAQFQGDVLVRSLGSDFGQYRMKEDIYDQLKLHADVWLIEKKGDKEYISYYKRSIDETPSVTSTPITSITAARASRMNMFDHLFYLLRVIVAGICVGGPLYLIARLRWLKRYLRTRSQLRYKDRVLNAFLGVGVFAVIIVGVFGLQVITAENDNAIRSWIRAQLDRVEEYLTLNAQFGELPSEVLARADVNDIAEKVGLDINVYENTMLTRTSREQLVEDRLIDERLPVDAYYQLFYEGVRNAYEEASVGNFDYTAGYRVLSDNEGQPRYVISVPTLPEQERIEEERARTVAYLFGALLLLVIAVMLTASLLANALSRPIGRLREGLELVARGRFERPLPVNTRDEIGALVQTFNSMQEQLAESRRKLTQQERQLAWREMARQVAHEIKNPLTPMKLSVQHLRRAYSNLDPSDDVHGATDSKFKNLFDRITTTLIEQVDALARIANEFSSFARMPKRLLEPLDLNAVVREAVDLMQEQVRNQIVSELHEEPLVLEADREELRRIYINLIKNAIEASSHKKDFKIKVSSRLFSNGTSSAKWAYSTVEDDGTGIAGELVHRIFEPNFSSKTSGTGLGLAIVKKSIEDLHGEIGFETEEHVGTTFWIKLPLIED